MKKIYFIPLLLFISLVILFTIGLKLNPREVPSPLIGKPVPNFSLPLLGHPEQRITQDELKGHPLLLNVWASWCTACREEHALLLQAAKNNHVMIYGLDYKDRAEDAHKWLNLLGNPYRNVLFDQSGRVAIDFGVYGVPETFVIDKKGFIRYKHIGAITEEVLKQKILPLLQELDHEPG